MPFLVPGHCLGGGPHGCVLSQSLALVLAAEYTYARELPDERVATCRDGENSLAYGIRFRMP